MRGALLVALAGCYSPSTPTGVPCASNLGGPRCPTDQVCIDEVCRARGGGPLDAFDAPPDIRIDGPPGDNDADGVADAVDDCPDDPDPQQANEDGDKFGDACDPCPPVANDAPIDGDGDGVQDECDPNPAAIGDRIVLFEGFNAGLPAGWRTAGTPVAVAGAIMVAVGDGQDAWIGPPGLGDKRSTVGVGFTITAFANGANGAGPRHAAGGEASVCALFVDGDASSKGYGIIDLETDTIEAGTDYVWALNVPYMLLDSRRDGTETCAVRDPAGVRMSLSAANDLESDTATLDAFARGFSGKFLWLMHVDSP